MKLYPTLSLSTQVYKMGTGDILLGVTLRWTNIPSSWAVATLSVASRYRNRVKLRPCEASLGRVGLLGSCATSPYLLPTLLKYFTSNLFYLKAVRVYFYGCTMTHGIQRVLTQTVSRVRILEATFYLMSNGYVCVSSNILYFDKDLFKTLSTQKGWC